MKIRLFFAPLAVLATLATFVLVLTGCSDLRSAGQSVSESSSAQVGDYSVFYANHWDAQRIKITSRNALGLPESLLMSTSLCLKYAHSQSPIEYEKKRVRVKVKDNSLTGGSTQEVDMVEGCLKWQEEVALNPEQQSNPDSYIDRSVRIEGIDSPFESAFFEFEYKIHPWSEGERFFWDSRMGDPKVLNSDNQPRLVIDTYNLTPDGIVNYALDHLLNLTMARKYILTLKPKLLVPNPERNLVSSKGLEKGQFQLRTLIFASDDEMPKAGQEIKVLHDQTQPVEVRDGVLTASITIRYPFQHLPLLPLQNHLYIEVSGSEQVAVRPARAFGAFTRRKENHHLSLRVYDEVKRTEKLKQLSAVLNINRLVKPTLQRLPNIPESVEIFRRYYHLKTLSERQDLVDAVRDRFQQTIAIHLHQARKRDGNFALIRGSRYGQFKIARDLCGFFYQQYESDGVSDPRTVESIEQGVQAAQERIDERTEGTAANDPLLNCAAKPLDWVNVVITEHSAEVVRQPDPYAKNGDLIRNPKLEIETHLEFLRKDIRADKDESGRKESDGTKFEVLAGVDFKVPLVKDFLGLGASARGGWYTDTESFSEKAEVRSTEDESRSRVRTVKRLIGEQLDLRMDLLTTICLTVQPMVPNPSLGKYGHEGFQVCEKKPGLRKHLWESWYYLRENVARNDNGESMGRSDAFSSQPLSKTIRGSAVYKGFLDSIENKARRIGLSSQKPHYDISSMSRWSMERDEKAYPIYLGGHFPGLVGE